MRAARDQTRYQRDDDQAKDRRAASNTRGSGGRGHAFVPRARRRRIRVCRQISSMITQARSSSTMSTPGKRPARTKRPAKLPTTQKSFLADAED